MADGQTGRRTRQNRNAMGAKLRHIWVGMSTLVLILISTTGTPASASNHFGPTLARARPVSGVELEGARRMLLQGSAPSGGTQSQDLPSSLLNGHKDYTWQKKILDKHKKNNRVIVCGANYGFRSWIQQWYVSLRRTGATEIVIIALDAQVFEWAKEHIGEDRVIHFDLIDDTDVAGDAHRWRTKSYTKVVSQRAHILRPIVEMGIDVLYSDTDISWYQNPWPHIDPTAGQSEACDYYVQQEKSEVVGDYNCSGFMFIRSNIITRLFMKIWEEMIVERVKKPGFFTDQEELNILFEEIYRGPRKQHSDWSNFKACVLPAEKFPVGVQYYFKKTKKGPPKDKSKPVKIASDCKLGKECLGFNYSPLDKPDPKWKKSPPVIIHHNYIKGNAEKVARAKKFGLWLHLEENQFE